jgi:hypothetical protein
VGRQFIALLLCALFGLEIIGVGAREQRNPEEPGNAGLYRGVFLKAEQPHSGQDRGDESDTINVNAPSMYRHTSAQTLSYHPGSLTPIADPYGNLIYWTPA